ncbi:MAG: glutamyl-tRNA reductase [Actinomycetota bacterium]
MGILSLGISFRRAPIELLERLAFTDDDFAKAYRLAQDLDGLDEVVILSTCNRVEAYGTVASYHAGFLALKRLLTEPRGVPVEELAEPLYSTWEQDAADHLFSVAAGLDSMVLGETQIHAQVREAIRRAEGEGAAGPGMTGLFHAAVHAGRRVRQETSLGAAPDAFVSLGADLAEEALGELDGRRVVVIGAGQMSALTAKHLRRRGVGPVRILNRSLERARSLAERTGAEHGDLDALPDALVEADLVVSATGAAGYVLGQAAAARAMDVRDGRPLVLLDLAVPRDVDPETAYLDGVRLIDIVAVRQRVEDEDGDAARDIETARTLVSEEVRRWVLRRRGEDLAPVIRALRAHGEQVVQGELGRWNARLADLTPDEREAVEGLARAIAAKLLHDPIVELKERSDPGSERAHARLLAELLRIDLEDAD